MGPCGQFIDRMAFQIEPFYQYQQATFSDRLLAGSAARRGSPLPAGREGECASRRHEYAIHVIRVIRTPASARRQEASLDLPVDPPRDGESKQAWSIARSASACSRARCRPARASPSTRSLAQRWRIARSTVEAAYDQLRGEGYTAGTVGSGTYVAAVIPDNFFRKGLPGESGASLGADARDKTGKAALAPARLAAGRPARPLPHEQPVTPADQAESAEPPFASRSADAARFPMAAWSRAGRQRPTADAGPADTRRAAGLARAARTDRALPGAARGIVCDASQVGAVRHPRRPGPVRPDPADAARQGADRGSWLCECGADLPSLHGGAAAHRWPGLCRAGAPARREAGPCDARAPVAHRHHHARVASPGTAGLAAQAGVCRGGRLRQRIQLRRRRWRP